MKYVTKTEEWILIKDGVAYIGLTAHAVSELGDIVYLDLPEVGDSFQKGEVFGAVESVKAASDIYMPIGGSVKEVNEALLDNPELLNENPDTMIIAIEGFDEAELADLEVLK